MMPSFDWHAHPALRKLSEECSFNIGDGTKLGLPLIAVSPGFERLTGFTNGEMIGKKCGDTLGTKGDGTTSYQLQAGEFAFMSAGPDRRINNWMRNDFLDIGGNDGSSFDDEWHYSWGSLPGATPMYPVPATEEVNEDNIVEVGS